MTSRVIVLDMPPDRGFAAALVVDGQLEDLILDPKLGTATARPGTVHMARIDRKLPGGQGAFVSLGSGKGFLRDAKALKPGEQHLVQVVSLPEPGKAPTVTTRVLFKGPRLILTPHADRVNVSRQIRDEEEAARLKTIVTEALERFREPKSIPPGTGVIVRTMAKGAEPEHLASELGCLADQYRVRRSQEHVGGGGDAVDHALTEWLLPPPDEIICTPKLARTLSAPEAPFGPMEFWGDPRFAALIRAEDNPFDAFDFNSWSEQLRSPEVSLGGGSMVIEPTRAMVTVDVNTGSDFGAAAGLKANLAAARDLPRQLSLRGLGGLVIVDFAPMSKKHRKTLEEALKKAFRADPVETSLVGWTRMGLYEIQRKRERLPLHEVL